MGTRFKKILGAFAALLLLVLLTCVLAPTAHAAENEAASQTELATQIQTLIDAGDPGATQTVATGFTSQDEVDAYLVDLSDELAPYVSIEVSFGVDETAGDATTYSVIIYASPQWSLEDYVSEDEGIELYSADSDALQAALEEGWESLSPEIKVSAYRISTADIKSSYYGAIVKAPEQFNVRTYLGYSYIPSTGYVVAIKPRYLTDSASTYATMRTSYEAKISEALAELSVCSTDLAKVYLLHDWICNNVTYNNNTSSQGEAAYPSYTSYGAMVDGLAVCQGYSLALSDLLERAGIENTTLLVDSHNHAWNMVAVDGSWYHVDSTWDDKVTWISRSWFMKSDTGIVDSIHADWSSSSNYGWDSSMVASSSTYDSYNWNIYTPDSSAKHEFGAWTGTEPTCTAEGVKTRTCSRCGYTETKTTAALGHDYGEWRGTEPTCTTDGVKTRACSRCSYTETKTTAALGHNLGEWEVIKQPTAHEAGLKKRSCQRSGCDYTETEEVPALGVTWSRLYGDTRLETMQAISQEGWQSSESVVIACSSNFPDALAANALAGSLGCPVLLTESAALSDQTKQEIERLGATTAYITGGSSAIAQIVEDQIKQAGCTNVVRLYGNSRQETATEIAKQTAALKQSDTCIIACGSNFPDALAISPYSYATSSPIFLTEGDNKLSESTLSVIKELGYTKAVIVGGSGAVSTSVEDQLVSIGIASAERKAGDTRYETASQVASWCVGQGMSVFNIAVASGANFPDALAGSALCGKNNSVLALVQDSDLSCITGFVTNNKDAIEKGYVFGGTSAVSESVWDLLLNVTTN